MERRMSTEQKKDAPLKPIGPAGQVIAPNPVESGSGIAFTNGAAVFSGSAGADQFIGSKNDDIFLSNGTAQNQGQSAPDREQERFDGRSGHDVAVLPGFREDYRAVIPGHTAYPQASAPAWEKTDTLYGTVVVLENIHTGGSHRLNGVESVVFDNGNPFANPKQAVQNLPEKLQSGAMTSASTRELFLQAQADLSPAEQRAAKIAATRECAQEFAGQYKMGMGAEAMNALAESVVSKLDQSGLDVDSRKLPEAEPPAATTTQRAFAMDMKPL